MNSFIESAHSIFPDRCRNRILLVGGCVRDKLLGLTHRDIDLISTLPPDEISACGFRQVTGKSTAPIWFRHDETFGTVEVTLISDENALEADLRRRDFTINAMAMTLAGDIVDPLKGRADLDHMILRACSPETFLSDPLRIFRALRFEADGWKMDHVTELLIREREWSRSWEGIPVERFSREMIKALQLQQPELFFQRMLDLSIGEEYLPEIFRMPHIPAGPLIHHPEGDLFTHSCQVLQRVSEVNCESLTRFCAIFHDIGKLATSPTLYPKHHGHGQAGFSMAIDLCKRLRLPAHYGKALAWVSRLHGTFNLWDQLRDSTKLRLAEQAIKAGIVDILPMVAAADKAGGSEPEEWKRVIRIAGMSASDLGIDKAYLESMPPSWRPEIIKQRRQGVFQATQTSSV